MTAVSSATAPHRILVIRLSAMGDVAMTVPVVAALRVRYPQAEIVLLTPSFLQPFFREIEGLKFYAPDFGGRHKGFWGVVKLSMELGRFDMVADLHDVIRTKMLRRVLRLRGAHVAYIDKGRDEKKALVDLEKKVLHPLKTTIERYRDVFLALGLSLPEIAAPARLRYALSPSTQALVARAQMGAQDIAHTGKWIGIAPFAQHEGKIYPLPLMTQVIELLLELPQVTLFIFGGGATEQAYAEQMEQSHPRVISAIGRVKLGQEMELISHLDLMVSMDSSAMHMASLVGVEVVSIWGATHPYAGFYGMGQSPENAIQLLMDCRPCSIYGNKPCVRGNYPCMREIPPRSISDRVRHALNI